MYIFPEMIELGFADNDKRSWTSEDHKIVAQNICLCNSKIANRESLIKCVSIINKIPQDRIRKITAIELYALGIPLR